MTYASPLILANTEPHLILSADSFIVVEANEAFAQALGVSRRELIGRSVLQWVFEDQRTDFTRTIRMTGRHPLPPQFYFHWKITGGKLVQMEITSWMLTVSSQTQVLALCARPRSRGNIDAAIGRLPLVLPQERRLKTVG